MIFDSETRLKMKLRTLVITSMLCAGPLSAMAQTCSPLRIVVGLSAGGGIDVLARTLAQRMTEKFGMAVIVENKTGAGGNIAASYVAKAAPDGCTLLMTGNNHTINPMIYAKAGYELKDFAPVVRTVDGTSVIVVHPQQPFKNIGELVAYAKANPRKLSYSSSGIGLPNHVAMEMFLKAAKIEIVHVPYKGSAPALADTVAGVAPVSVTSAAAAISFLNSGRLRALAVSAPKRSKTLPSVPTLADSGLKDATAVTWLGVFAPAATPLAVRTKLNQEFNEVLAEAPIREKLLATQSYETVGGTVQEFDAFVKEDERATRRLMQDLKITVE